MNQSFAKEIRQIIDAHSGGMKFLELMVDFYCRTRRFEVPPSEIEDICRTLDGVKVLEYSCDIGDGMRRAKMFIYTP